MSDAKRLVSYFVQHNQDLILELGCGHRKRHASAIGIDLIEAKGVDIVGDIYEVLTYFPNDSVSGVYAYHCFEHLPDIPAVITDLARIMKNGAKLIVVVPHFSNPYYYSDFTHQTPFGLYSFSYVSKDNIFSRKVPNYIGTHDFELCKVDLIFKSPRPFYLRWGVKKILQSIFNLNTYFKEFYEENLCFVFPCYEIRYELRLNEDSFT